MIVYAASEWSLKQKIFPIFFCGLKVMGVKGPLYYFAVANSVCQRCCLCNSGRVDDTDPEYFFQGQAASNDHSDIDKQIGFCCEDTSNESTVKDMSLGESPVCKKKRTCQSDRGLTSAPEGSSTPLEQSPWERLPGSVTVAVLSRLPNALQKIFRRVCKSWLLAQSVNMVLGPAYPSLSESNLL